MAALLCAALWATPARAQQAPDPLAPAIAAYTDLDFERAVSRLRSALTLVGILAMRWNVVIGGQLFSKSFLGYTTYKMGFATREGLLPAIVILILPFIILAVLVRILPPWTKGGDKHVVKA